MFMSYKKETIFLTQILNKMNIIERMQSPTPKFFKKVRNIGLILAALATTIATAPVTLPTVVIKIAGYLAVAGGIAGTVSQTAVEGE